MPQRPGLIFFFTGTHDAVTLLPEGLLLLSIVAATSSFGVTGLLLFVSTTAASPAGEATDVDDATTLVISVSTGDDDDAEDASVEGVSPASPIGTSVAVVVVLLTSSVDPLLLFNNAGGSSLCCFCWLLLLLKGPSWHDADPLMTAVQLYRFYNFV
jgi:hypothetical protein